MHVLRECLKISRVLCKAKWPSNLLLVNRSSRTSGHHNAVVLVIVEGGGGGGNEASHLKYLDNQHVVLFRPV